MQERKALVAFISQFPADVLARVHRVELVDSIYLATVDCGPTACVIDATAPHYATTPQEACEKVKAWLLDDIGCDGKLGNRSLQPHWSAYHIKNRLGVHWQSKLDSSVDNG